MGSKTYQLQTVKLNENSSFEFSIFTSGCTLSDGSIFLSGGGFTNTTYVIKIQKDPRNSNNVNNQKYDIQISQKKSMRLYRKEHVSLVMNGYVYVLGGFESIQNQFIADCERFNLETEEWEEIRNMNRPRCAFGAVRFTNYRKEWCILVVGGFNGQKRMKSIELYDQKQDSWTELNLQLPQSMSGIGLSLNSRIQLFYIIYCYC